MCSWSFTLRDKVRRTDSSSSSSASSDPFTSSPSRDPSSETDLFNDLDFSIREEPECVPNYKPNPFSIARINAATRAAATVSHITEPIMLKYRQAANHTVVPGQQKHAAKVAKEIFKPGRILNDGTIADALMKKRQDNSARSEQTNEGKPEAKDNPSFSCIATPSVSASSTVFPPESVSTEYITKPDLREPQIFATPEPPKSNRFRPPAISHLSSIPRVIPSTSYASHPRYISPLRAPEQASQVSMSQSPNAVHSFITDHPIQVSCSAASASPVFVPAVATSSNFARNASSRIQTPIHSAPPGFCLQVQKVGTRPQDEAQPRISATDSTSRKRISVEEDEEHYEGRSSIFSTSPTRSSPPRKKWRMMTAAQKEDAEWSTLNVEKPKKRDTPVRTTGKFSLAWLKR